MLNGDELDALYRVSLSVLVAWPEDPPLWNLALQCWTALMEFRREARKTSFHVPSLLDRNGRFQAKLREGQTLFYELISNSPPQEEVRRRLLTR